MADKMYTVIRDEGHGEGYEVLGVIAEHEALEMLDEEVGSVDKETGIISIDEYHSAIPHDVPKWDYKAEFDGEDEE